MRASARATARVRVHASARVCVHVHVLSGMEAWRKRGHRAICPQMWGLFNLHPLLSLLQPPEFVATVNFARRTPMYHGKLSWCSKFELMDTFLKICTEYTETLILSAIHSDSCGHKPNCGETCQHSCTPHSCLWRRLHRRLLSGAVPMTLHLLPRSAALPLLLLRRVSQGTACAPRPRPRPRR